MKPLPVGWASAVGSQTAKPYFVALSEFLDVERREHTVFPPESDVFAALELTAFDDVRVAILGQDPYHDDGQAHGLAFSVRPGVPRPPSLRNILRELETDVGCSLPASGSLVPWAAQGVLLLNTVLTVRAHAPASHKGVGWERFTDAIIRALSARPVPVVFVLWGAQAQRKRDLIDTDRHAIVESAHPSPLSAHRGFFGSKPFSKANEALRRARCSPIDWCLPID